MFAGAALSEPHFPPPPPSAGPAKASRPAASEPSRAGKRHTRGLVNGCAARGATRVGLHEGVGAVCVCAFMQSCFYVCLRALFPLQMPAAAGRQPPACCAGTHVCVHIRAQMHCGCRTARVCAHPMNGSTSSTRVCTALIGAHTPHKCAPLPVHRSPRVQPYAFMHTCIHTCAHTRVCTRASSRGSCTAVSTCGHCCILGSSSAPKLLFPLRPPTPRPNGPHVQPQRLQR